MVKVVEVTENVDNYEKSQIVVDRVRHFLEFQNPSLLKMVEEMTLFNRGEEVHFIEYILEEFRTSMHIFDSDGTPLEFHNTSDSKKNISSFPSKISIDFPISKPFLKNTFRTIKFEYIVSEDKREILSTEICLALYPAAKTYVFIKQCDFYEFNIHYFLIDHKENELDYSRVNVNKKPTFCEISVRSEDNESNNLIIVLDHKIPSSFLNWYKSGILFGSIAVLSGLIAMFLNPESIRYCIISSSIAISFMVIIKGWLFQKEMDKVLVKYDKIYLVLIYILIITVVVLILYYSYISRNLT